MTTRKNKPQYPEQIPTKLIVTKDKYKADINLRITMGETILNKQIQTQNQFEEAQREFNSWDNYNSELLKQCFNKEYNEHKTGYDNVNMLYNIYRTPQTQIQEFNGKLKNKITILKHLLETADIIKSEISDNVISKNVGSESNVYNNDVFIVHGHNNEVKINVARTLEKLGLNPIILHEQPNSGMFILEKIENYAKVGFAIILLTDDDLGKEKNEESLNFRARQNVIFEVGYFFGILGRSRVCTLYSEGVELPTDLLGLLHWKIDDSESWKFNLVKELRAAGYNVDANDIN